MMAMWPCGPGRDGAQMCASMAVKPGLEVGSTVSPAQVWGSHSLGKAPRSCDACLGLQSVLLMWCLTCSHVKADI